MFKKPACLCLVALFLIVARVPGQTAASIAAPATDYHSNPKFVEALKQAKQTEHSREMIFAPDAYKKANKLAGGKCMECLQGWYASSMKIGDFKDAMAASTQMEDLATQPREKSKAATYRGQALLAQAGDKAKPAQLEGAHAAFQDAITLNPKNGNALFADGKTLARLGKMDDARTEFQQCLSCIATTDPARVRAEHFAENPELATHKMAPRWW